MPSSMCDQIADDVLAAIDAATLSQTFTPTRLDLPRQKLEDISGVVVTVVPRAVGIQALSRAKDMEDHEIDVAIQAQVTSDAAATLAPYRYLAQEIARLFRNVVLSCGAAWFRSQIDPIYDPDHLEQHMVFTSVVRLTIKVRTP